MAADHVWFAIVLRFGGLDAYKGDRSIVVKGGAPSGGTSALSFEKCTAGFRG